jgi:hypothetical protein
MKSRKELLSGTGVGGTLEKPFIVQEPLVIMFRQGDSVICHLHPAEEDTYEGYGILICDLVRHVARCFDVNEDDVWDWVDKERDNPTDEITNPS